jgi:hypothetical protein
MFFTNICSSLAFKLSQINKKCLWNYAPSIPFTRPHYIVSIPFTRPHCSVHKSRLLDQLSSCPYRIYRSLLFSPSKWAQSVYRAKIKWYKMNQCSVATKMIKHRKKVKTILTNIFEMYLFWVTLAYNGVWYDL